MNVSLPNELPLLDGRGAHVALRRDTNGAILVLGIAFGATLVSALYYLVSLAQVILWREAAQNAADAGAFENALWHARGMNTIAGLNILMSMLSTIIVTWRMTLLALVFATATPPVGAGPQTGLASNEPSRSLTTLVEMLKADSDVANAVTTLAASLSDAQSAVALYTPSLATLVRSPARNLPRDTGVVTTMSASSSPFLIAEGTHAPEEESADDGERRGYPVLATTVEPWVRRLAEPNGLPVSREDVSAGCPGPARDTDVSATSEASSSESAMSPARVQHTLQALGLSSRSDGALALLMSLYGHNSAAAPNWFCANASRSVERVKTVAWQLAAAALRRSSHPDEELLRVIDAHVDGSAAIGVAVTSGISPLRSLVTGVESETPESRFGAAARVWPLAANGSFHFRSAAVVSRDRKGADAVNIPAGIVAQAEAYFDCDGAWRNCNANAMWQLSWRARLRRVQPFARLMQDAGVVSSMGVTLLQDDIRVRNTDAYARLRDASRERGSESEMFRFIFDERTRSCVIH
ncbi:MAG TPA: hypothetical protein VIV60_02375 [Polyangiaceae bacterium]